MKKLLLTLSLFTAIFTISTGALATNMDLCIGFKNPLDHDVTSQFLDTNYLQKNDGFNFTLSPRGSIVVDDNRGINEFRGHIHLRFNNKSYWVVWGLGKDMPHGNSKQIAMDNFYDETRIIGIDNKFHWLAYAEAGESTSWTRAAVAAVIVQNEEEDHVPDTFFVTTFDLRTPGVLSQGHFNLNIDLVANR